MLCVVVEFYFGVQSVAVDVYMNEVGLNSVFEVVAIGTLWE